MKKFFVFKQEVNYLKFIGVGKDEFDSYIKNNFDDVTKWNASEIEESLNLGDVAEDNPIVIECLENGNEWVVCYPDAECIIYTQKSYDNAESMDIDFDNCKIYFKEENLLTDKEKELVK